MTSTPPEPPDMVVGLDVSTTVHDDYAVVEVAGEVDLASSAGLSTAIVAASATGVRRLVVDIAGVTYFDSHGMRSLVEATDLFGEVTVAGASATIRRVFEVIGLDNLLT